MEQKRILAVEDNDLVGDYLKASLARLGYEVLGPVTTGEEAVAHARTEEPDLILMDINLAGVMTGIEAADLIRSFSDVPVIYLTGETDDPFLKEARITAPYGYLVKPVSRQELAATIEMALYRHGLESKLKESENRLRLALSSAHMGIWDWNAKSSDVFWSPECREILGEEDLGGTLEAFTALVHPEDLPLVMTAIRRVSVEEPLFRVALRIIHADGQVRWIAGSGQGYFDGTGTLRRMAGVVTDITDRKKAEKELIDSEQRYRSVFENSLYGIMLTRSDGDILAANKRACDMLGMTEEEMILKGKPGLVVPDERMQAAFAERARTGRWQGELTARRADGSTFPAELSSTIFVTADGSRMTSMTIMDVTERKRAEEGLRASEQKFRAAFMTGLDAVCIATLEEGRVIEVNDEFEDVFGYTREEVIGRTSLDLDIYCEPADRARMSSELKARKRIKDIEVKVRKKGGRIRVCSFSGSVMHLGGEAHILGMIRDITERKEAEDALRSSRLQLTEAADMARIAYWEREEATGGFIFNDAFYDLYGTTAEKEGGYRMSWEEFGARFVHPDDLPELNRQMKNNRDRPRSGALRHYEHRVIRGDGEVITTLARTRAVLDSDGNVTRSIGVNQDITARKKLEESLREYEKVVESSPDMIAVVDRSYRYLMVNSAFLRHRTLDRSRVIGRTVPEVLGNEVFDQAVRKHLDRCFQGVQAQYERKYDHPGLGERDLSVSYLPIRGREGIDRVACVLRDVTEARKASRALQRSERKYQTMFDTVPDGFASVGVDKKIVEANPAFQRMVGYTEEELRRMTYKDFTPEKWHARQECVVEEQVLTRGYSDVYMKEYTRRDGTTFPVEIRTHMLRDEEARPGKMWSFVRDVTGRVKAEDALRESETKLRAILENSRDAIGVSKEGIHVYVNPAYVSLFGYRSPDELIGTPIVDLIAPASRDSVMEMPGKGPARDQVASFSELTAQRKDGTTLLVESTTSPYELKGDRFVLAILRDVSEKRRLEEQLRQAQKMEAIGTLAGGVAHDFNNILTVIMGLGNLMQMSLDKDDLHRPYVDQIVASSERAADLTMSLLAFSRKQRINLEPHTVNGVLASTGKLLERLLPEDIGLTVKLTDEDTSSLLDVTQIGQVLMNLATNARDAMPHGGSLSITTALKRIDDIFIRNHGFGRTGEYVKVSVSDTGTGMDEETMKHIFEPFFTTKEVGKGTGLGLASAFGIVKQHGGYIAVSSIPSRGTTFDMYLPLVRAERGFGGASETQETKGGAETILIVEDDRDVRHMLTNILESQGYTTMAAVDGDDAVRIHGETGENIDLIILDVVMPGKNGKQTLDRITRDDPGVRAIFVSGYTGDIVLDKGVQSERVDFLQKPISVPSLLTKVREVLDR